MSRKIKTVFVFIVLIACLSSVMIRCSPAAESGKEAKRMEKPDHTGPEYTSKYICPMHCAGSGSDQMGICPVCQMDYELNVDAVQMGKDTSRR